MEPKKEMNEHEAADDELRAAIVAVFMKAVDGVLNAVTPGPSQVVLALDDAMTAIKEFQHGMRDACREARNGGPLARPHPPSGIPSKGSTMPSPSESGTSVDGSAAKAQSWHLADQLPSGTQATSAATASDGESKPPSHQGRHGEILPPPPDGSGSDLATATTDRAPSKRKPKRKPKR